MMALYRLMKIPEHLKMRPEEEDIKEWCLVRYNTCAGDDEVNVSGPLALSSQAPGYLGFVRGYIGAELLTFDTPEEHVRAYLRGHNLPADYVEQNRQLMERLELVRFFTAAQWLSESGPRRELSVREYTDQVRVHVQNYRRDRSWDCL